MAHFGNRLHNARRLRDLKQRELAAAAHVNINTISRAERSAKALLRGEVIVALAQKLAVSTDYLLGLQADNGGTTCSGHDATLPRRDPGPHRDTPGPDAAARRERPRGLERSTHGC